MPHFVVEYTANLGDDARIAELLSTINRTLRNQGEVFPVGGIRSRAVRVTEYAIADEAADYAFVHGVLTIGTGRSEEVKKRAGDAVFAAIKEHYRDVQSRRYLALSFELTEFTEAGTWKANNLHERFRSR